MQAVIPAEAGIHSPDISGAILRRSQRACPELACGELVEPVEWIRPAIGDLAQSYNKISSTPFSSRRHDNPAHSPQENQKKISALTQLSQFGIKIGVIDSAKAVSFHHKTGHLPVGCISSAVVVWAN